MPKEPKDVKKIAIAGAGGLGSHLTHRMFDFGVNRGQFPFTDFDIDLFEADSVDVKNLLHQNYEEADLGRSKGTIMAERYAVNSIEKFMTAKDFSKYDLIFSCVDDMVFRKSLYEWSWKPDNIDKLFWIDGRCESRTGIILNSSIPRAHLEQRLSDDKERKGCLLAAEKEANISHTLPIIVSAAMVQVFLNFLRGDPIPKEKLITI